MRPQKIKIAVLDIETQQFKHGRVPEAFAAGFMTDEEYTETWGPDCIAELMADIMSRKQRYVIYAHNGGKFDFHYLYEWLENPIKVINGRIVRARCGKHWLQDSFSIIPVGLAKAGDKLGIDYGLFEWNRIEKHKRKIRRYLEADCAALLTLVNRFEGDFGRRLTVGQTAMMQYKRLETVPHLTEAGDAFFRPFYFGGRVQAHRGRGDFRGPYLVLDKNSMYPAVMKEKLHPWGGEYDDQSSLPEDDETKPYFAEIEATSKGALPVRSEAGAIEFPHGRGRFQACSHEIIMARRLGLLEVHSVEWCKVAQEVNATFAAYVDHFWRLRRVYEAAGDKHGALFCKFMLNALYGKFGTNPAKFRDWLIVRAGDGMTPEKLEAEGWEAYATGPAFNLYNKSAPKRGWYYDVGVAASITSAGRASLLEAMHGAEDLLYSDTDSIICRGAAVTLGKGLGEWKIEDKADRVVIAGKKLYALQYKGRWGKVKAKGGALTGPEMVKLARGGHVDYEAKAPTFGLSLDPMFIKRRFEATIDERDM